jgi:hypothetical protein
VVVVVVVVVVMVAAVNYLHLEPDSSTVTSTPGVMTSRRLALKASTYDLIGAKRSTTEPGSSAGARVICFCHVWNLRKVNDAEQRMI